MSRVLELINKLKDEHSLSTDEYRFILDNYTDEQLADMAMKCVFGSGSVRKTKLGDRYEAVQKIINQKTSSAINNQKLYHKVVKGDTLSKIAKKYNTSVSNIMKLNSSIKDANMICLGQLIRVK